MTESHSMKKFWKIFTIIIFCLFLAMFIMTIVPIFFYWEYIDIYGVYIYYYYLIQDIDYVVPFSISILLGILSMVIVLSTLEEYSIGFGLASLFFGAISLLIYLISYVVSIYLRIGESRWRLLAAGYINLAATILLLIWYISMIIGVAKGQFKRKRSPESIKRKLMRETRAKEREERVWEEFQKRKKEMSAEPQNTEYMNKIYGLISVLIIFCLVFFILGSFGLFNVVDASVEIKRITNEINQSGETIELLLELAFFEPIKEINTIKVLSYWGIGILGIIVIIGYLIKPKERITEA